MKEVSLFQIADEVKALFEMIAIDEGEMTESHEELMTSVQAMLSQKTDSCVLFVKSLEDEIEKASRYKKEIDAYIKTRKNAIEKFQEYCRICLSKMEKSRIQGSMYEIATRKPMKSLYIKDENKVPADFVSFKPEIDKAKLKDALKNGSIEANEDYCLIDGKIGISFKNKSIGRK